MIEVRNLSKRYGDVVAVDDLTFEVQRGEVVGFLGPNGAGKSTTMKMITGTLQPDEGVVCFDGAPITDDLIAAKRRVGYLPEANPLYDELLVAEYLEYVAELRGLAPDTTYYFAIKAFDEFNNASPISNNATGTTTGPPEVSVIPERLDEALITGQRRTRTVTLRNDGAGEYAAAGVPVVGRERVARFHVGITKGAAGEPTLAWCRMNGLPALVLEFDPHDAPTTESVRLLLATELRAVDVFHGDEDLIVKAADVEDRHHVRVAELGQRLPFP